MPVKPGKPVIARRMPVGSFNPMTFASSLRRSRTLGGPSSRAELNSSRIVHQQQYVTHSRSTSSNRPAMANVTGVAYVTALCCNMPT
jgi:hypothetical protein